MSSEPLGGRPEERGGRGSGMPVADAATPHGGALRRNAPYGTFRLGRDFSSAFSVPSSNVFLVKMSYWLNY